MASYGSQIRSSLYKDPMIIKSQFCGGVDGSTPDAHGSCPGDSGSAAIKKDYLKQAFVQMGVLHGSIAFCNAKIFPTVFTRSKIDEF